MKRLATAALGLVLAASAAGAGPDRVSLLFGSYHINARDDYDQLNPGVFLTWEGRFETTLGVYRNSYGKIAESAQVLYPVANWKNGQLQVFAGIAHYPGDGDTVAVHLGDLIPIAGLSARWGNLFAVMIPCFCEGFDALVAGGVTFPIGQRP